MATTIADLARKEAAATLLLGLRTYFTTGPKETRAWTIRAGMKAPQAVGVIHTDFERGFIRAQTIGWPQLLEAGSMVEARSRGWLRSEGRDYVVAEGTWWSFFSMSEGFL